MCRICLLLIPFFVFSSCDDTPFNNFTHRFVKTTTITYQASGINKINASTLNGSISVHTDSYEHDKITADISSHCWGKDTQDAKDHLDSINFEHKKVENSLNIDIDMPDIIFRNYGSDIDIVAPNIPNLRLKTVNGSIFVDSSTGSLDLRTSNGHIDCNVESLGEDDILVLNIINGGIDLDLPSATSANLEAQTENGGVSIEGIEDTEIVAVKNTYLRANLGKGGAIISLMTTNGDIFIQAR